MSEQDLIFLKQKVAWLTQEMRMRPIRVPTRGGSSNKKTLTLVIIGGNTLAAGVPGIKYAPGPIVPLQVYDPEVDTVYPDGMGRANLYVDGVLQPLRVLVRHNYAAYKAPIIGGSQVTAFGTESLIFPVPPVVTPPPVTMTLYTFAWGELG